MRCPLSSRTELAKSRAVPLASSAIGSEAVIRNDPINASYLGFLTTALRA
jgi:hypothetical protein